VCEAGVCAALLLVVKMVWKWTAVSC